MSFFFPPNEGQERVTSLFFVIIYPYLLLSLLPLLILIVLHNCVMWTLWSLKCGPYAFIITRCLEPVFIFVCSALYILFHNKREQLKRSYSKRLQSSLLF